MGGNAACSFCPGDSERELRHICGPPDLSFLAEGGWGFVPGICQSLALPTSCGVGWEYLRHVGMKALPLAQDKRPEKDDAAEPSVTAMQSSWGQACQPATRIWVEHPCRKPPQGETARGQTSEAGPLWVGKGPRQEPESQEKWGAGWSPKKLPPLCRGDQRAAERRASRARALQPAEPHRS